VVGPSARLGRPVEKKPGCTSHAALRLGSCGGGLPWFTRPAGAHARSVVGVRGPSRDRFVFRHLAPSFAYRDFAAYRRDPLDWIAALLWADFLYDVPISHRHSRSVLCADTRYRT